MCQNARKELEIAVKKNITPTESEEQIALFRWAEFAKGARPELSLLHHIPNGGSRHKAEAARLKAEGVKAGVPDLCLPVPRGRYHGLYIELKRKRGGRVSGAQSEWMEALLRQGYCAAICYGWEEAKKLIEQYLNAKGGAHPLGIRSEIK